MRVFHNIHGLQVLYSSWADSGSALFTGRAGAEEHRPVAAVRVRRPAQAYVEGVRGTVVVLQHERPLGVGVVPARTVGKGDVRT